MCRKPFCVKLFMKQDQFYTARLGWHYDGEEQVWSEMYGRQAMALPFGHVVDFYYRIHGRMCEPAAGDNGAPWSG
jgi:hypothetical protein